MLNRIKGLFALVLVCLLSGFQTFAEAEKLVLVKDGEPQATIILAEKPVKSAQLAAFELQDHIRQITGTILPIVDEKAKTTGIKLFVGKSNAAIAAGAPDDFTKQEYAVLFKPNAIIMIGNDKNDKGKVNYWLKRIPGTYAYRTWPELFDENGTLYAVYDFLEQFCDVRWFDNSEFGTDVIKSKTLTVTGKDLRRSPTFQYRDPQGRFKHNMELYDRQVSNWTVRWSEATPKYEEWLKLIYEKGKKQPECKHPHSWLRYQRSRVYAFLMRRKLGGEKYKVNHSFYGWYNRFWKKNPKHPELFVEKKTDWFARGYPDAKVPPQLCYTNPEVVEQCIKDMHRFYALSKEDRNKKRLGVDKVYPIVPMDNNSYCKCPECLKLGPSARISRTFSSGDNSRMFWSFVNKIAKTMKKSYPDKYIGALAYATYAIRPEGMKIEDNISVQLCLFPRYAATNPEGLKRDDMILKQWADGRPLYLWIYTSLTAGHKPKIPMFPKPMGNLIGPLFQKYHKAGVKGIFFDGMAQETEMYLFFKLADDPYQDYAQLLDDYFVRMYGPKAGKTLKKFYKLVESIYTNPRNHSTGAKGPALFYGILGTGPRMKKLAELVNQAEKELVGAPELWRKRFDMFKFGTWDYMNEGRTQYEKNRVVKVSKPIGIACPLSLNSVPAEDPTKVDWIDAQAFGGYNGWLKDNGDISLRKITSRMTRYGDTYYLRLTEKELDRKIGEGDFWEILLRNDTTESVYKLRIDKDANITGRVVTSSGAPQDWSGHHSKAVSSVKEKRWDLLLAMPVKKEYLDKYGRMFINIRRNDAKLADSPVLVATGNKCELAKTGALVTFDKPFVKDAPPPAAEDLILDWLLTGKGSVIKDVSGHGNDGTLHGAKRCKDGVEFNGGRYKGPGQYLKISKVKGLDAGNLTFSCWLNYSKANSRGGRRIFTWGAYHSTIAVPYRKLMLLASKKDGKITGAGPFGPELPPKKWFMYTMTFDGKRMNIYENGRRRGGVSIKSHKLLPPDANSAWLFGGHPKLAPWYTFIGEMKVIQIYGRSLSPEEIMAKYKNEFKKYRKGKEVK